MLPASGERLQIHLIGGEHDFDLQQDGALLEVHPRVKVGRMSIALGVLHRLAAAGEAADLHLKVKALEVEHVLARLIEQGCCIWRLGTAAGESDHDREAGDHRAGP